MVTKHSRKNFWHLGLCAPMLINNGESEDFISFNEGTPLERIEKMLSRDWGVTDEKSFYEMTNKIKEGYEKDKPGFPGEYLLNDEEVLLQSQNIGSPFSRLRHSMYSSSIAEKSTITKLYMRHAFLTVSTHLCGYINEESCWEDLYAIGKLVRQKYSSWREYGEGLLYSLDSTGEVERLSRYHPIIVDLFANETSAWMSAEWSDGECD